MPHPAGQPGAHPESTRPMDSLTPSAPDLLDAQRRQARIDLAAAHRLAVLDDYHEAIDNHFTLLVPGRPRRFYLNEFGLHWNEVTASNLIEVAFDGTVVEGQGPADRSAICIHAPIHEATGAACVLNTHMPYRPPLSHPLPRSSPPRAFLSPALS